MGTMTAGESLERENSRAKIQRRTMWVLALTQVVGTVGVGVAPSIGVLLAGEVTQNEAWAGLARTASTLGAALMGIPLGNLAAQRGRRFALSLGWWIAAAGSALLVFAAQYAASIPLFLGLLMIGAGSAAALQARFAATDLALPTHRSRSLSLIVWVGTLGSVLGPNLGVPGKVVGEATGLTVYASAFLIAACSLALAGALVFVLLRPDPLLTLNRLAPPVAPTVGRRPGRLALVVRELRENPRARYAAVAILSAQIVMVSIMTMTPVHLEHQGGSIAVIGLTISLRVAGMYALSPIVGIMADRLGHRPSILVGIVIFLLSFVFGIFWSTDMGWMMTSLILLGVGWSFVNVTGSSLFSAALSDETRASAQGGIDALSNLCGATAAFLAGPLLAASSFPVLNVWAILVLLPLALLTLRRPRSRAGNR